MNYLERETYFYVRGVIQERLGNDPARMIAFWNVSTYLDLNRNMTAADRSAMINDMFGTQHRDLAQVYYTLMQDQCDDILLLSTPAVRNAKLNKVVMMCFCIQFMDLFRQRFNINQPFFSRLSNVVQLFTLDQLPELYLRPYFQRVFTQFPAFRTELQARVSRRTSLQLSLWDWGPDNNPGPANPPPQTPPPQV